MKLLLTMLAVFLAPALWAQGGGEQAARAKKINAVVAAMPAEDSAQYAGHMKTLALLGEQGLEQMALMLNDTGKVKRGRLELAIAGYSNYAAAPGNEALRLPAARAWNRALGKMAGTPGRLFLIEQLQVVGGDEIVGYLLYHIQTPALTDAVARALVKINSVASRRALLNSLYGGRGMFRTRLAAALGDVELTAAAPVIGGMLPGSDDAFREAALSALSKIAWPGSLPVMAQEAARVRYAYTGVGATGSYMLYLKKLLGKGYRTEVDKAAWAVWNAATAPPARKARLAALSLLAETRREAMMPLLKSMLQADRGSRVYALNLALRFLNDADINQWMALLKTSGRDVQEDLITMLGSTRNVKVLPAILPYLNNKDAGLQQAALRAVGRLGRQEAQSALLETMLRADTAIARQVQSILLELRGSGADLQQISAALPAAPRPVQLMLIEVLGRKAAISQAPVVFNLLGNEDQVISDAAYRALPWVVTESSIPELNRLLLASSRPANTRRLQEALVAAVNTIYQPAQRMEQVRRAYEAAPADRKHLLLEVFGQIGTPEALEMVRSLYDNGQTAHMKRAALEALGHWPNSAAAETLYRIAQKEQGKEALAVYTAFITKQSFTPAQRLLELRRAMELAATDAERAAIVTDLGRCATLPGLLYAGNWLKHPQLKNAAAEAVYKIATGEKNSWNGAAVAAVIEKAMPLLNGADADYQRQALRRHLEEHRTAAGFYSLFNEKDLSGWKGLVANPVKRAAMPGAELQKAQRQADSLMRAGWSVSDGLLVFNGKGQNLCTEKLYGDFELYVDWKISAEGDAGIYLRGSPQVQIWDTSRVSVGAQVGSGGLYNNQRHLSRPLALADNAIGAWNSFYIKMAGDKVTVYLNGVLVTDNVVMENYWDRSAPIFPKEQLELQAHGTYVAYRNLYIRELDAPRAGNK